MERFYRLLDINLQSFPRIHQGIRAISFASSKFTEKAKDVRIELQFSEIEAHKSDRKGERYHDPPRTILDLSKNVRISIINTHKQY